MNSEFLLPTDLCNEDFTYELNNIIKGLDRSICPSIVKKYGYDRKQAERICGILTYMIGNLNDESYEDNWNTSEEKEKLYWNMTDFVCSEFDLDAPRDFVLRVKDIVEMGLPENLEEINFKMVFKNYSLDNLKNLIAYIVVKFIYDKFECSDIYVVECFNKLSHSLHDTLVYSHVFNEEETNFCRLIAQEVLYIAFRK